MDPITPPPPPSNLQSPTSHLHLWQSAAVVLAVVLLALLTIGWLYGGVSPKEPVDFSQYYAADPYAGWLTYASDDGFSFRYPPDYSVNMTADPEESSRTIYHIVSNATPAPPVMQITFQHDAWVTFSLWEGIPWDGYADIVESFTLTRRSDG